MENYHKWIESLDSKNDQQEIILIQRVILGKSLIYKCTSRRPGVFDSKEQLLSVFCTLNQN